MAAGELDRHEAEQLLVDHNQQLRTALAAVGKSLQI
jgi:N-acetylmuramic acid 6-phosphate etherase